MKLTRVAKNLIWNYFILCSHICDKFATNTDCQPVPSLDGQGLAVCTLQNNKCASDDPWTINDLKIYYTYTWN